MLQFTSWLENNMLPCLYKQILGISCPGCGIQRSIIELLNGNLIASIKMYPALLPIFITLCISGSHFFFKFNRGDVVIKYFLIFSSAIVVINFFCKLF